MSCVKVEVEWGPQTFVYNLSWEIDGQKSVSAEDEPSEVTE